MFRINAPTNAHRVAFVFALLTTTLFSALILAMAVLLIPAHLASAAPTDASNIVATMWAVPIDADGNGKINVGDQVSYTIILTNTGGVSVPNVLMVDRMNSSWQDVVSGTATTSKGQISAYPVNYSGSDAVVSNTVSALAAGEHMTIRFRTQINSTNYSPLTTPLPPSSTGIPNFAKV